MKQTQKNKFRVSGMFGKYGAANAQGVVEFPARVWIGKTADKQITPTTIINLRDAHGNTDEVLAGEPGLVIS